MFSKEHIELFNSLFRGREDIFATRWEKGGKSGYMPSYTFDPYRYRAHRMRGGTFQNFTEKQFQPLTEDQILKHLRGEQFIGIYPLLEDNHSWFIAADFDEDGWENECQKCIQVLDQKGIPAYLERSRSGKGGHVWIFFERSYPAYKSRKILTSLLEENQLFSILDKKSSFDRLFPNQDYLSGKGFGNLIALPFHKDTMEKGNGCFIDPATMKPYHDQWEFLKTFQKVSIEKLDILFEALSKSTTSEKVQAVGKLTIQLSDAIYLNRSGLNTPLINFLKDELNFSNTEFFIKKQSGKNTWGTERYFKMIQEDALNIIIPRGFIGKLIRFCVSRSISYELQDERPKNETVVYSPTIQLREHQKVALESIFKKDFGVIVAPPGSGKTVMALWIIAERKQPALIIVHRKQLADQWIERIESFLGISKKEIGKIGDGKSRIGNKITVAMIQSLEKTFESQEGENLKKAFGTIIIDECHHVPAQSYRNAISKLNSYYVYGLTATPFRKYNDGKMIFIHLGEVITEVKQEDISLPPTAKIVVRNTDLDVPYNSKTDKFETLSKVLVHDSARNKIILNDVTNELDQGKKAVIVTERKEHIEALCQYLKKKYETITLSGDDSESGKAEKWKALNEGSFQVLITTGQYFGEGSDIQKIQCLFLVYPFAFEGKLIQYIGRVQRSEITPTIYDYRDHKIDYLERFFQKRNQYYKKFYLQETLFESRLAGVQDDSFIYEERVSIPFQQLEFIYGGVAFKHKIPTNNIEVSFEVENPEIRPEFEVLKPYFAKVLNSKDIKFDVTARFHNGIPLNQNASSIDLKRINREIIDSVKFRFVSKGIIGKVPKTEENLLDVKQLQDSQKGSPPLYDTEQELLEDILKTKKVKHQKQLIYLSQKHERGILKLRFVLSPFSFVFLLAGRKHYHVVWETLDSEDATYVWHIEKNLNALKYQLQQIDKIIGRVRLEGRQSYLESNPANFSRIVHDYSDERAGFVIWKDMLEERLT